MLGTIQVLCHHVFDLFRTTHLISRRQQTSAFPHNLINMTSEFPHTHPLSNIVRPLILYMIHNPKSPDYYTEKCSEKNSKTCSLFSAHSKISFLPSILFSYYLLTSAYGQPHPPTLSSNISIWPPPPTHIYVEWSFLVETTLGSHVSATPIGQTGSKWGDFHWAMGCV